MKTIVTLSLFLVAAAVAVAQDDRKRERRGDHAGKERGDSKMMELRKEFGRKMEAMHKRHAAERRELQEEMKAKFRKMGGDKGKKQRGDREGGADRERPDQRGGDVDSRLRRLEHEVRRLQHQIEMLKKGGDHPSAEKREEMKRRMRERGEGGERDGAKRRRGAGRRGEGDRPDRD